MTRYALLRLTRSPSVSRRCGPDPTEIRESHGNTATRGITCSGDGGREGSAGGAAAPMLGWDRGGGFSVDAAVRVPARHQAGLEWLIGDCARPMSRRAANPRRSSSSIKRSVGHPADSQTLIRLPHRAWRNCLMPHRLGTDSEARRLPSGGSRFVLRLTTTVCSCLSTRPHGRRILSHNGRRNPLDCLSI